MPMIQFVMFEIVISVTISSDDLISLILISGNLDSVLWVPKGGAGANHNAWWHPEPTIVLLFYSWNMNIIFCHVLYSPLVYMLVNRVFMCPYVVMFMKLWHWKRRVAVWATWSLLVAPWVFRMTAYGATGGSGVVGLTTFCFRCDSYGLWNKRPVGLNRCWLKLWWNFQVYFFGQQIFN